MAVYGEKKKPMDATTQWANLRRLGKSLSGKGAGSADAQAGRGAQASRSTQIAAASSRSGGQGRSVPTSQIVNRPKRDKTSPKMNPTQKASSFVGPNHIGTWDLSAKKK